MEWEELNRFLQSGLNSDRKNVFDFSHEALLQSTFETLHCLKTIIIILRDTNDSMGHRHRKSVDQNERGHGGVSR